MAKEAPPTTTAGGVPAAAAVARPVPKPKVSSEVVETIVSEAELLCQELSAVLRACRSVAKSQMQDATRGSEPWDLSGLTRSPQHIHALLVERAERAARRVVELDARIEDL